MNLTVSNINFGGHKNPQLHLRRKQIKRLKQQELELKENCKTLQANCEALELPLNSLNITKTLQNKTFSKFFH